MSLLKLNLTSICGILAFRIGGGKDAPIGSALYAIVRSHLCGCAILSDEWALTAAHCIKWYDQMFKFYDVKLVLLFFFSRLLESPKKSIGLNKHS